MITKCTYTKLAIKIYYLNLFLRTNSFSHSLGWKLNRSVQVSKTEPMMQLSLPSIHYSVAVRTIMENWFKRSDIPTPLTGCPSYLPDTDTLGSTCTKQERPPAVIARADSRKPFKVSVMPILVTTEVYFRDFNRYVYLYIL